MEARKFKLQYFSPTARYIHSIKSVDIPAIGTFILMPHKKWPLTPPNCLKTMTRWPKNGYMFQNFLGGYLTFRGQSFFRVCWKLDGAMLIFYSRHWSYLLKFPFQNQCIFNLSSQTMQKNPFQLKTTGYFHYSRTKWSENPHVHNSWILLTETNPKTSIL